MPDSLHRLIEHLRQTLSTRALALQQVPGHALRRFLSDAGQYPQGVDQFLKQAHG
jgi:hypothetical protein